MTPTAQPGAFGSRRGARILSASTVRSSADRAERATNSRNSVLAIGLYFSSLRNGRIGERRFTQSDLPFSALAPTPRTLTMSTKHAASRVFLASLRLRESLFFQSIDDTGDAILDQDRVEVDQ